MIINNKFDSSSNKKNWFGAITVGVITAILVMLNEFFDLSTKIIDYIVSDEKVVVLQVEQKSDTEYLIKNSIESNKAFHQEISSIEIIPLDEQKAEYSRMFYFNYNKTIEPKTLQSKRNVNNVAKTVTTYSIEKNELKNSLELAGDFLFSLQKPFEFKFSYPYKLDTKEFQCEIFFETKDNVNCIVSEAPNAVINIPITLWYFIWYFILLAIAVLVFGIVFIIFKQKPKKSLEKKL